MSLRLLNSSLPCIPLHSHLTLILNLHFPQILSDITLSSQPRTPDPPYRNWSPLCYSFHRPSFIHLQYAPIHSILCAFVYLPISECLISKFTSLLVIIWGRRWRSWLRHCAPSRKVAGSIPDGVTGIFHWHNPPGRTVALGLTQPLTEMSTRNVSWG